MTGNLVFQAAAIYAGFVAITAFAAISSDEIKLKTSEVLLFPVAPAALGLILARLF